MRLSEILGMLMINPADHPDAEISSVTCSTDKIRPGSLFAAVRGAQNDGHEYLRLAASKGAVAAIGDREIANADGLIYIKTDNAELAYTLACAAFYGNPQRELKLIGVTGTNGKTTVTTMLRSIIAMAGVGCGLIGTVENICGGKSCPASLTTPPAEELFALLRGMADAGDHCCVMEVSSHALARNRVYGIDFDVGVMTNVTRDHLDFHKTMEAYAMAKASLMEKSRISIVNADDSWAEHFIKNARKCVTYAIDREADFRAREIVFGPDNITFTTPLGKMKLPAGGRFAIYNALAAMAAAKELGLDTDLILAGTESFRGVKGRMELLKTKGKYKVYIDYAHTPDGLENVLKALRAFAPGRIITVFGCGGDRDRTKRPIMGEISGHLSDFSVVTSDNPRTEDPAGIIADILSGIKTTRFIAVPDRREAVRTALGMAGENDIVLLAGKGHETYQIVGTEKLHMDEREFVQEFENEA
ncbi:MAG: UDP-N-acetylmuramoyl-L-alanyl-D-glutamate--2,6-diaminopimelate ligase [Oscillospiraceae bacterium]|nr:UDP-N-acetylmuramoyl-L-alanyl-D-glutamate--2,6-diaminopimelate ligase [Oscillospiraceae bacterium]